MQPDHDLLRLLNIIGTLGNITRCRNGVIRKRRTSNKVDFRNAPTRAANRHNASEFGRASTAGRLIRQALRPHLLTHHNLPTISRLTSALRRIVALDTTHAPGQRQILPHHLAALNGFNFNLAVGALPTTLRTGTSLTRTPTNHLLLTLPSLPPATHLNTPKAATHYALTAAIALLDLTNNTSRTIPLPQSPPIPLTAHPLPENPQTYSLSPTTPTEVAVIILGISFYQQEAGHFYPLPPTTSPLAVVYAGPIPAPITLAQPPHARQRPAQTVQALSPRPIPLPLLRSHRHHHPVPEHITQAPNST